MIILAVDTATEACSAALWIKRDVLERFRLAPREHTSLILPMVQSLLDESGIALNNVDAVAFGCGPGSFTGLRIAAGVAQGIAYAADLPVVPVSTLAAMAQQAFEAFADEHVFAALDARMGEVYWGVYRRNIRGYADLLGTESVVDAGEVEFPDVRGPGLGSGWLRYGTELAARLGDHVTRVDGDCFPRAAMVARLASEAMTQGGAVPAEMAQPVYLRDNVARKMTERSK